MTRSAKKNELVRYGSHSPFAFLHEMFERFDLAMPRVDISHEDDQLIVEVDLPGISPDDIDVFIDDYWIELRGERRSRREKREGNTVQTERSIGQFERVIPLPHEIEPDSAEARFHNGVLEIRARVHGERGPGRELPIKVVDGDATKTSVH